ncbi:hypothetical protein GKZ68_13130 [Hymenobacter sp. BRD128]|uniref:DUF4350 domain-containing protein n=1 Tax=Hymenobacter sp. BRD128 TaxID=2675878 RepID=UPI0015647D52|nr:DUF4350 domain-containing protein [Hymenobacter sp. BRD128]QKG57485.1 hypothetical protein GKZ68_13130 [Hymenobacter sp. BRD128]
MTSSRLYLLGLLALIGAYVSLEYYRPKPIDWRPSLSNTDKIPYGTYALFDVLPQLLATDEVTSVRLPIYNQLFDQEDPERNAENMAKSDATESEPAAPADSATSDAASPDAPTLRQQGATYLFINNSFAISRLEVPALLKFAAAGNDVFIAAERFDGGILRALGVQLRAADAPDPSVPDSVRARLSAPSLHLLDSVQVHFTDPGLSGAALRLPASAATSRLALRPGHAGTPLATDAQGRAVLLRLDRGRGHVYVCTVPLAFSNYFVLPPRRRAFALAALSYLPTGRPVWWDEYQKQGREGEQSVLRVLFSHPSLRTAYYLLWVTAVLFIFIEARRRQRIIPVIKPLPNTTLLFTRTVAGLYQQGRNHQRIAEKKTALFLDYLRTRFQEPTPDLADEDFRERLSQKSGVPRARVDELVRYINFARTAPAVTDRELLRLSRAIHDFKREAT